MVDVTVIRGAADVEGEIISNPLITNNVIAVQRGRKDIEDSTPSVPTVVKVNYRPNLRTGQIVEIVDALQTGVFRAIVESVDLSVEGAETTATLTTRRIDND